MVKIVEAFSKGVRYEVVVDDDFKWDGALNVDSKGYPRMTIKRKAVKLSRYIMDAKEGELVDHINRNPLDNRRENLRICTYQQNQANKIVRGYSIDGGKYVAQIKFNRKSRYLGRFDTKEEALRVYRAEHVKLYGEFSPYFREVV